jgi:hypothetical protein
MKSHALSLPALSNLTSNSVNPFVPETNQTKRRPSFPNKDEYRDWCTSASTSHVFYSGAAGLLPGTRITSSNPGADVYAIVADYDAKVDPDDWRKGIDRLPAGLRPTWLSRTFSGGVRAVWMLEKSVPVHGGKLYAEFLKVARRRLLAKLAFPGFDVGAFDNPNQYYELGTNWQKTGDALPAGAVTAWLMEAGATKGAFAGAGVVIPIEKLRAEVEARFPGRWQDEFDIGQRGCRFWDPSADAQTAAIVRAEGMQCFTGASAFVGWAQIFGSSFVRKFQEDRIGDAVDGIWYDGRNYGRKAGDEWVVCNKDEIILTLRARGLSKKSGDTTLSEVEQALVFIQNHRRVNYMAPCVFQGGPTLYHNGARYLNTSTVTCVAPAEKTGLAWGEGFPWIAAFMSTYFDDPRTEQLEIYHAWLKRFYSGCYADKLEDGQALFIAGPPGRGKSLLSRRIVSGLVGGHGDPGNYLMGLTRFNKDLGTKALLAVDDNTSGQRESSRTMLGEMLKKVVSGVGLEYEAKFQDRFSLPWHGRFLFTLNEDPEALRVIPNTETSIMDKLIFLKCSSEAPTFASKAETESTIGKELPAYARWLLEWQPPDHAKGAARFGVREFHHPIILSEAQSFEDVANLEGLILDLIEEMHGTDKKETEWKLTLGQLVGKFIIHNGGNDARLRRVAPSDRILQAGLKKILGRTTPVPYLSVVNDRKRKQNRYVLRVVLDGAKPEEAPS